MLRSRAARKLIGESLRQGHPVRGQQGLILQHLAEEALGGLQVARGGEQEVNRRAVLVDGPVQVAPLATDLDVSLVDAHRTAVRLTERAPCCWRYGRAVRNLH